MSEGFEKIMSDVENIRVQRDGNIVVITMNRPKALNALNDQTLEELDRVFTCLEEEREVLPDLVRFLQMLGRDGQRRVLFQVLFYRYYNYDLEKPFLPQYRKNHQDLLAALQLELKQEG